MLTFCMGTISQSCNSLSHYTFQVTLVSQGKWMIHALQSQGLLGKQGKEERMALQDYQGQ